MSTTNNSGPTLRNIPILGQENVPSDGVLLIPSQLSFRDLLHVEKWLAGRPFSYLVDRQASLDSEFQSHLQSINAQVIDIQAAGDSLAEKVHAAVNHGNVVIYLPPHIIAQPASLTVISGERLETLLALQVPVLPLYVLHTHELALAIDAKSPDDDSMFEFGPVLRNADVNVAKFHEELFVLAEHCFSLKPSLNVHLAYALLQGLKKHGTKSSLIDGKDDKVWRFDKILAVAIVLSKHVKEVTQKPRVGILLPPGFGATVANLAVLFAGKIPVNMNFTAGRASVESAMKQADLDHYLTADLFVRKVQSFPWPANKHLTFIERLLPQKKAAIGKWLVLSKILPASVLATLLGIPKKGGQKEAVLLFTSGSSGEPKGVVLSHRNLIANVCQFSSRLNMKHSDGILGCLPMFHSFGCTVTLWFPIIQGINVITYPTPLESKKLAELVHQHKITLMISTPTFLRSYLKGINPELLASLKLVVTGAEKLPKSVAEAFQARFGKTVLEGYGLTETSPVSNVNLPDPELEQGASAAAPSYRFGSVGQLIPGIAVRTTDLDTDEPLPVHQSGMIWFKGANIFEGYLGNQKKTDEVVKNGWFRTGDIGRLDSDGFLYIEGRLSRFSKIGGEMVPHETVEAALLKAMDLEGESTRQIAVVGVPDPDKGEALVLLCAVHENPPELISLRHKLLDQGVPALWIPKKIARVSEIPMLASGKLDMKGCETAALKA